jgi:hypothetical protein
MFVAHHGVHSGFDAVRRPFVMAAIAGSVAVIISQQPALAIDRPSTASAAAPTYSQPLTLNQDSAGSSTAVTAKDLNGDGLPDLVNGDSAGNVQVVLNRGGGAFGDPATYPVDGSVGTVVVDDVNGDGHPDIVSADTSSGNVAVLLNKGNGTFNAPHFYSTGGSPFGLAIGDVTGDGKPDIVTSDQGTAQISVLSGKGDGTFTAADKYGNGLAASDYGQPQGIALGDFRGKGELDVLVADGGTGSAGGTYVTFLPNNGHGVFPTAQTMGVGDTYQDPGSIVTGDFNGDGHLDFAVDLEGGCYGVGDGDVVVFLGDGTGSFNSRNGVGTDCTAGSVVADVNGDGIPDLVTAVGDFFAGGSYVAVNIGKGDGTFYPKVLTALEPSASPSGIARADLTGHGGSDVVIAAQNGDDSAVFDEDSGGPALLLGTVRDNNSAVAGAAIQLCRAAKSSAQPAPCQQARVSSQAGNFAEPVTPGDSYAITAFPPSSLPGLGPRTVGPVNISEHVTVTAADFSATLPPSGSTLTTATGSVQENEVPTINWGEPSTYTTTGCQNGFGDLLVSATNTATGQPETETFPMKESPAGSGTYVAQVPALEPLHGESDAQQFITCPGAGHIFPDGGSPGGGTTVLMTGTGFTGASAVSFGSTPATSYTIEGDDLIAAVAPAGTGQVAVNVTRAGGVKESVGTYAYAGVSSLDTTSGSAAGGTTVTIHGSGFTNVSGVIFGVVPAQSFQVVSPTEVQATSPVGVGTVQVQVVQDRSVTAASTASEFTYTGGPAGDASLVEGTGSQGLQQYVEDLSGNGPTAAAATVERTRRGHVHPADDGGDFSNGSLDCSQSLQAEQETGIAFGQLCGYVNQTVSNFGPTGAIQSQVLTGMFVGGATTLALAGLAIPGVDAVVAAAIVVGFIWGFLSDWSFKIDPSGTVVDTAGNPIAGATATLQSYDGETGGFVDTPKDPSIIDPTTNPETTTSAGGFDWDAIAGTYRVAASASGCHAPGSSSQHSVDTAPFTLPPPAVGLVLTLDCGHATTPKPAVTSLSPASGLAVGGDVTQIDGTGLARVTSVHFGKKAATNVHVLSPYAIQATAPAGSGTAHVTVTSPGGTSTTSAGDQYSWLVTARTANSPTVTGVAPASGPTTGGTSITVHGTHFTSPATVGVAGTAATDVTVVSSSTITANVPAATAAGPAAVTVTTGAGTSMPTSASGFTYGAAPVQVLVSNVQRLHVVPSLTRSGSARLTVRWRLPSHATSALACLTTGRSPAQSTCARRVSAAHSAIFTDRHPIRGVTITVFARDSAGDLSQPLTVALDGTTATTTEAHASHHRERIGTTITDATKHKPIPSGRAQLWRQVGRHAWHHVATKRVRKGKAFAVVPASAAKYEWRYAGTGDRNLPAVSRAKRA